MARAEPIWPMYFYDGEKPLRGQRVIYQRGDAFELQTKDYVRSIGAQCGVPNARDLPFSELPYVKTLNVRSPSMQQRLLQQGAGYKQAAKLLGEAA